MDQRMRGVAGRCGFTVIELLVVIAIISILASLLAPVLRKTLNTAESTQCLNNLRQTGFIFGQYADDNNDYLPSPENPNLPTAWSPELNWGERLAKYYTSEGYGTTADLQRRALLIFRCPSLGFYNGVAVSSGKQIYGINPSLSGTYITRTPIRRANVALAGAQGVPKNKPNAAVVIGDSLYAGSLATYDGANAAQFNRINSGDGALTVRHNGCANVLHLDGSARSVTLVSLLADLKFVQVCDNVGNFF